MGRGPSELQAQVLAADLCTACGACLGHCPYLKTLGERVAFIHPCPRDEGRCFEVCPRASLDPESLDRQVLGAPRRHPVLGGHDGLYFARALDADVRARGQYGGVATALTLFALESGLAGAALVTGGTPTRQPHAVVARDRDAVLAAAGTKYSACPTLEPLAGLLREGGEALAVVGRPCQVAAARKVEAHEKNGRLAALIGIFCFWALAPAFYRFLAGRPDLQRAIKMDLPKDGDMAFVVNGRAASVPLDEIRPLIRAACQTCFDPTAEWADVSVGSTEYDPAWNTLVVRTARGRDLVERAGAAGALEVRPYPPERIPILEEAVQRKKLRVLDALESGRPEAAYLRIPAAQRDAVRAHGRA
ncbi:MAG: hypothetical protein A2W08_15605 [Candidatus Rokubacteria bacterium RBG_16_73_20]|nr:MAG: hypothetical protein A2050_06645 [Candidatus Rokubacteria bacterium GWA2_73_35]OGK96199.1 MAG: hypothetical protein A2W08_15605 [Candidatus Rokubacteria bacterium RBG_16_73_20]